MKGPITVADFFSWRIDEHTVMFAKVASGADEWRPSTHYPTLFKVWGTADGRYRACIAVGGLVRLSVPQLTPHIALDECAEWFRRKSGK